MEEICSKAIEKAGGPAKLATAIIEAGGEPITSQAISQWKRIPAGRVIVVEAITGLSRHELRPDVFGKMGTAA